MENKKQNFYKGMPSIKQIEEFRMKTAADRIEKIKQKCSELKNSAISKNEALKIIKNICLEKSPDIWDNYLKEHNLEK